MEKQQEILLDQNLQDIIGGFPTILPEIVVAVMILVVVLWDLLFSKNTGILHFLMLTGVIVAGYFAAGQWTGEEERTWFLDVLILDNSAIVFRVAFLVAAFLTIILSIRLKHGRWSEYYAIICSILLGALLIVRTQNLLLIYVSMEMLSIGSYILTTFSFNKASAESGLKYVLFGGLATGIMLYGLSLIYGFTGTLNIGSEAFLSGLENMDPVFLLFTGSLILAGFLFKISAFPFHVWTPDVYQAAPTPVVGFFSIVPKLGGFVVIARITMVFRDTLAIGETWQFLLAVVAMASMTIGNFSALWQDNAKRLMAYSSIAHSGFLLVGIVAFSSVGWTAFIFYGLIYLLMNIGGFGLIQWVEEWSGKTEISDYAGFGRITPWIGVSFLVLMLALIGLPPTAGFTAKFLIFSSLWDSWQSTGSTILIVTLVFGLLNTVVALFYYLKFPFHMFFRTGNQDIELKSRNSVIMITGIFLTLLILILFFQPAWLMVVLNNVSFAT